MIVTSLALHFLNQERAARDRLIRLTPISGLCPWERYCTAAARPLMVVRQSQGARCHASPSRIKVATLVSRTKVVGFELFTRLERVKLILELADFEVKDDVTDGDDDDDDDDDADSGTNRKSSDNVGDCVSEASEL